MGFGVNDGLSVRAVAVPHEFIDRYMAAANGEYVKVFLYLLRHESELDTLRDSDVADALNLTEADVRRALLYWEKAGVLTIKEKPGARPGEAAASAEARPETEAGMETAAGAEPEERPVPSVPGERPLPPRGDGFARMERLADDEEFSALIYAVQQYLGKTFTQIECEKFAYFYDGLGMTAELLEFLAEYCADGGHTGIRYIEKVALNWYQLGIRTREEARVHTLRYSKEVSAVMKAFGITGRSPAAAEQEYMKKWFREYGFDRKLVTEACDRTIRATGAASFPYADKILTGWKENGVKTLSDVEKLDKERQVRQSRTGKRPTAQTAPSGAGAKNRFNNFDGRSYDYEGLVFENIRRRHGKGEVQNGAQ